MFFGVLKFLAISVAIYFAIALGLILSQPAKPLEANTKTLDFQDVLSQSRVLYPPSDIVEEEKTFATQDGARLPVKIFRDASVDAQPILVMVHGSGWHGAQFDHLGRALADLAEVRIVTLRGHGATPERRGDVDYIGQFEDDLAALLADAGDRKVILLGHSSGGGLVVRMAGGKHGALIDKAVLLAPFLQYDAPTTRPNSGGWAHVLTRRAIGLSMLNNVGLHALDHLTVIQFSMPQAVLDGPLGHTATTAYSWRLNQGFSPRRDWAADVAGLPDFLLIAGTRDEAFDAAMYQPTLETITDKGRYELVPDVGHLGVVDAPQTLALIREFLQ